MTGLAFDPPLTEGRLIRRYKRFLADVEMSDGRIITASCPNTGSMMGLTDEGNRVWLSESGDPKRKYRYRWELVECSKLAHAPLVGINTHLPNRLVASAIGKGLVQDLAGYETVRREVKYGDSSRIDILLEQPGKAPCYVEIKNVTLSRRHGLAEFPDAPTLRGEKHLRELAQMAKNGARAVMFYLVQRNDCHRFSLAGDIDRAYLKAWQDASACGLETLAWSCHISAREILLDRALPVADTHGKG